MTNLPHNCKAETCGKPAYKKDEKGRYACDLHLLFPSRNNKAKCINGHSLDKDNIYFRPDGYKNCRICTNKNKTRHRNKIKMQRIA